MKCAVEKSKIYGRAELFVIDIDEWKVLWLSSAPSGISPISDLSCFINFIALRLPTHFE